MKNKNKAWIIVVLILSACAGNDSLTDEELNTSIEETAKAIEELTSDLSCDSDQQCGVIKYGHKPCGGPMAYKLYSSKNTDVKKLEDLADEYFNLTQEYNERNQLNSDCSLVSPPEVMCNGICQVKG